MTRLLIIVAASGMLACAKAETPSTPAIQLDTLPGGIVRITSSRPVGWGGPAWRLESLGAIDPPFGSPDELINPSAIAWVDDDRIVVSDQAPTSIKIYDGSGRIVRRIGREGAGPGEYRSAHAGVLRDLIIVQDLQLARANIFDTAGTWRRSWPSGRFFAAPPIALNDGRVAVPGLVPIPGDYALLGAYLDFDIDGTVHDTVRLPFDRAANESVPFWTIPPSPASGGGTIQVPGHPRMTAIRLAGGGTSGGFGRSYTLVDHARAGDTIRIFQRAWTPAVYSLERRKAMLEEAVEQSASHFDRATTQRTFRVDDIPMLGPAFTAMSEDGEGNLWIVTPTASSGTRLDVFDPSRRWLGQVDVAEDWGNYGRMTWRGGRVAVLARHEDGRPYILRYRLVK